MSTINIKDLPNNPNGYTFVEEENARRYFAHLTVLGENPEVVIQNTTILVRPTSKKVKT